MGRMLRVPVLHIEVAAQVGLRSSFPEEGLVEDAGLARGGISLSGSRGGLAGLPGEVRGRLQSHRLELLLERIDLLEHLVVLLPCHGASLRGSACGRWSHGILRA